MKHITSLFTPAILCMVFTVQTMAQEVLPEVTVTAANYKYLRSANTKNVANPANLLERKPAAFDIKNSEFYDDDYDTYTVSFFLPDGYVLAVYDANGKLLRTAERYKNIALPREVRSAVVSRYPNWKITSDLYQVKYEDDSGARTIYKLTLQNGSKRLKTKVNEKGDFLD